MKHSVTAAVAENVRIQGDVHRITLKAPALAKSARPGQFVQVRVSPTLHPLLRRPFSIHAADRRRGLLYLLYRVVGEGTALLAGIPASGSVDVIGPLGNGFPCGGIRGTALLVGGGMGAAPMVFLAAVLAGKKVPVRFYLGLDKRNTPLVKAVRGLLPARGCELVLASDVKTSGYFHGFVTGALARDLERYPELRTGARAFACGPWGMFRAFRDVVEPAGVRSYLSLEEHMACGVGGCLGCVVKKAGADEYVKVCTDGPVFPMETIDLDHKVL